MPREFTANEFIAYYKDLHPLEYAAALDDMGYHSLHLWFSQQCLMSLDQMGLIRHTDREKDVQTWGGRRTRNDVWLNLLVS